MNQDPELKTLQECFDLLNNLSPVARDRVLHWLNGRFQLSAEAQEIPPAEAHEKHNQPLTPNKDPALTNRNSSKENTVFEVGSLVQLSKFMSKVTESEKALLMAAYLQIYQKQDELSGRVVNDYLKKFDEGVKNITSALRVLIQKNPALIIQTHKSGRVAQAQKKYKVTQAGLEYANQLINQK